MFYYDSTYILILIGLGISLLAQHGINAAFNKYSKVPVSSGLSGAQAASRFLNGNGLYDIKIMRVSGSLTDNYNPGNKTLNLSETVCQVPSVSAVSVAAHECGHALQDAEGYAALRLRSALVPVASFGSQVSWILFFVGLSIGLMGLAKVGIICFLAVLAFQLVTLPVEINASRRGLRMLTEYGVITEEELPAARKVLRSAALTYVAAVLASLLQLLRFILLLGGRRGNRD